MLRLAFIGTGSCSEINGASYALMQWGLIAVFIAGLVFIHKNPFKIHLFFRIVLAIILAIILIGGLTVSFVDGACRDNSTGVWLFG